MSAGLANISFDQQTETTLFDLTTGSVISSERDVVPTGDPQVSVKADPMGKISVVVGCKTKTN